MAVETAVSRRPAHGGRPAPACGVEVDLEVVKAIAWCRIGGLRFRPRDDGAFGRALGLGLLAQDPCWRATAQGEGVLIAAGLLKGGLAPERAVIHVLWASCPRYELPQFVAAWPDGLVESWSEAFREQREEAERFFSGFGDEAWEFWTTVEYLEATPQPVAA